MSNAIALLEPGAPSDETRADDAGGRAGDEDRRRMRRSLADRRHAARREHHERLGKSPFARRAGKRTQVARRDGREIRVGRRRRCAFVLPELWRDLVRRDDVHAWMPRTQLVAHRNLVPRVAEREEEAHRDGLRVADVRQRREIERNELAVRAEAALDAVTSLERDERLRLRLAQAIQVRTSLPPQVQQMLEARISDECSPRAAPFEQRIRRDRRAVREPLDVRRADGPSRREHRFLLLRRQSAPSRCEPSRRRRERRR